MYKRGNNIMEKGLKWLFGGLIAAVVMMFMLMVSSVDAQNFRFGDGHHLQHPSYHSFCTVPPILFIPDTNKNTTSSTQSFIQHSVNRDNEYQPNVTVNTPKPQR